MAEKREVFSNRVKYTGVFSFKDFYQFCYDYLKEEEGFEDLYEASYKEKIKGNEKEIEIKWEDKKKYNDYFRFDIKLEFKIKHLKDVEVQQQGKKIKTNQGEIEIKMKGKLVSDYDGKYEHSPFYRFLRSIYEKWVIPGTIKQVEDNLIDKCDDFLSQTKAFLDIEGKR